MTALLLGYEEIERARAFFIEALGFEEEWEVRDDSGDLTRSHVRLGDTVLMLDSARDPERGFGLSRAVRPNLDGEGPDG